MRRSRTFLMIILSTLMLFSVVAVAQDEQKEEEEDDTLRNLKRSVALFLTQGMNDDMSYIYETRELLDIGPFSVEFQSLPVGSRIQIERRKSPFSRYSVLAPSFRTPSSARRRMKSSIPGATASTSTS